jgi:hypothetical protein
MSTQLDPKPGEILLGLLKRAAAAHGIHEKEELGGVYDEAWPEWYAEHMARALAEQGYRIVQATDAPAVDVPEGDSNEPL